MIFGAIFTYLETFKGRVSVKAKIIKLITLLGKKIFRGQVLKLKPSSHKFLFE